MIKTFKLFVLMVLCMGLFCCSGKRPDNLYVKDGKLTPCPESPNCVSSQSHSKKHYIEPLSYKNSSKDAMAKLKKIILSMPQTNIAREEPNYLHVEFKSKIMGFVDDVEFFIVDAEKKVHVRSASRLGHSDFGANRKRIEKIRPLFQN